MNGKVTTEIGSSFNYLCYVSRFVGRSLRSGVAWGER